MLKKLKPGSVDNPIYSKRQGLKFELSIKASNFLNINASAQSYVKVQSLLILSLLNKPMKTRDHKVVSHNKYEIDIEIEILY